MVLRIPLFQRNAILFAYILRLACCSINTKVWNLL